MRLAAAYLRFAGALMLSVFLLSCSNDSSSAIDTPLLAEETALVTAEAIESFDEWFSRNVQEQEVVLIPASIDIAELASLLGPEFALRRGLPADVVSYWRVSSVREKSEHWEVTIESVAGENFFAGSQFFVRQDDGTFDPVEAKEVGETPTTVVS